MFQNLKVSTRLLMGFGTLIAVMVTIVVSGLYQMQLMANATDNINRSADNLENALRVLDGVNSMRRFQRVTITPSSVHSRRTEGNRSGAARRA